ncbi:OTU domain-containing protein 5 [Hondaea fermentalgiana]|uniref:ubiquitinyl hydrolase 1 n=1 Tax=Hondaea fermentalgiana TaxID=2315210 RepID=A0A2R5GUK0_9STRA|nr:OTU domain-containing protein 5 [Hondaea fermentalgiana]|eukprot:GBG34546.1 OTU domain-containing protein 5 [Hondaea fermentalgiana]
MTCRQNSSAAQTGAGARARRLDLAQNSTRGDARREDLSDSSSSEYDGNSSEEDDVYREANERSAKENDDEYDELDDATDDGGLYDDYGSRDIPSSSRDESKRDGMPFRPKPGDVVEVFHGFWREALVESSGQTPRTVTVRVLFSEETFECNVEDDRFLAPLGTNCFVPELRSLPRRGEIVDCRDVGLKSSVKGMHVEVQELLPDHLVSVKPLESFLNNRQFRDGMKVHMRMISPFGELTHEFHGDNVIRRRFRDIAADGDPRYQRYVNALLADGMEVVPMAPDGNCLFRAVSHQVYGTAEHHRLVRASCMDYMESERAYFEPFVVGGAARFGAYIANKRRNAVWGDDIEIQAMCEIYDRPAQVMAYDSHLGAKQLRTFHETTRGRSRPPIILSFYGGGHYDSIKGPEFEAHLLSGAENKVGELERERVAVSRARRAGQSEAQVGGLVASQRRGELDQVDADVVASREQYAFADGDLEQALAASLVQASQDEDALVEGAVLDSEAASSTRAALRVSDVEATEQEAILEAIRQSSEQEDITAALQASERLNEEEYERQQLEQALRESRGDHGHSASGRFGDYDEDDELQRALELSMSQKRF